jgi:hypothetical protein
MAAIASRWPASLRPSWPKLGSEVLYRLPALFEWHESSESFEDVAQYYILWIEGRLYSWSRHSGKNLMSQVAGLSPRRRACFLRSPNLCLLLRSGIVPHETQLRRLEQWLSIEACLSSAESTCAYEGWSALGDYRIDSADDTMSVRPANTKLDFFLADKSPERQALSVLLDTDSPTANVGWTMDELGTFNPYNSHERDRVISIIESCATRIALSNSTIGILISSSLASIASGKSSSGTFASMSARRSIGLATLANLHAADWALDQVIEAIVHEAIHSFIYKLELMVPLYTDQNAALYTQIRSPWTGRMLELHSFVHACFVWYGLAQLWKAPASNGSDYRTHAMVRAQSGFLAGHLCQLVSQDARAVIQPGVYGVLEELFNKMRAEDNWQY